LQEQDPNHAHNTTSYHSNGHNKTKLSDTFTTIVNYNNLYVTKLNTITGKGLQ